MRVHTIRITYSNGTVGIYVGKCPYLESEKDSLSITNIEIGDAEHVEENVLEEIRKEAASTT
jgi:hypothetical protein